MPPRQIDSTVALPTIQPQLMRGFELFLPRYLRKAFHSIAVNYDRLPIKDIPPDASLVVYANHPSWWDPLIAFYLRYSLFPKFQLFAPIDAQALEQYKIFKRMGFYGVEANTLAGAKEFLRRSERILVEPNASIWMTPEGRFCDVRDLDAPLMPGLSHLAWSVDQWRDERPPASEVWFIPVAFELSYWEERLPECLSWFGAPTVFRWGAKQSTSKPELHSHLTSGLRDAQRELAAASMARANERFEVLLSGSSGSWRVYDWFRVAAAKVTGRQVRLEHGQKLSTKTTKPS